MTTKDTKFMYNNGFILLHDLESFHSSGYLKLDDRITVIEEGCEPEHWVIGDLIKLYGPQFPFRRGKTPAITQSVDDRVYTSLQLREEHKKGPKIKIKLSDDIRRELARIVEVDYPLFNVDDEPRKNRITGEKVVLEMHRLKWRANYVRKHWNPTYAKFFSFLDTSFDENGSGTGTVCRLCHYFPESAELFLNHMFKFFHIQSLQKEQVSMRSFDFWYDKFNECLMVSGEKSDAMEEREFDKEAVHETAASSECSQPEIIVEMLNETLSDVDNKPEEKIITDSEAEATLEANTSMKYASSTPHEPELSMPEPPLENEMVPSFENVESIGGDMSEPVRERMEEMELDLINEEPKDAEKDRHQRYISRKLNELRDLRASAESDSPISNARRLPLFTVRNEIEERLITGEEVIEEMEKLKAAFPVGVWTLPYNRFFCFVVAHFFPSKPGPAMKACDLCPAETTSLNSFFNHMFSEEHIRRLSEEKVSKISFEVWMEQFELCEKECGRTFETDGDTTVRNRPLLAINHPRVPLLDPLPEDQATTSYVIECDVQYIRDRYRKVMKTCTEKQKEDALKQRRNWYCTFCSEPSNPVMLFNQHRAATHVFSRNHWQNMGSKASSLELNFWTKWVEMIEAEIAPSKVSACAKTNADQGVLNEPTKNSPVLLSGENSETELFAETSETDGGTIVRFNKLCPTNQPRVPLLDPLPEDQTTLFDILKCDVSRIRASYRKLKKTFTNEQIMNDKNQQRNWYCTFCSKPYKPVMLSNQHSAAYHVFTKKHWKNMGNKASSSEVNFWMKWAETIESQSAAEMAPSKENENSPVPLSGENSETELSAETSETDGGTIVRFNKLCPINHPRVPLLDPVTDDQARTFYVLKCVVSRICRKFRKAMKTCTEKQKEDIKKQQRNWVCTFCSVPSKPVMLLDLLKAATHMFTIKHWQNMGNTVSSSDLDFWMKWIESIVSQSAAEMAHMSADTSDAENVESVHEEHVPLASRRRARRKRGKQPENTVEDDMSDPVRKRMEAVERVNGESSDVEKERHQRYKSAKLNELRDLRASAESDSPISNARRLPLFTVHMEIEEQLITGEDVIKEMDKLEAAFPAGKWIWELHPKFFSFVSNNLLQLKSRSLTTCGLCMVNKTNVKSFFDHMFSEEHIQRLSEKKVSKISFQVWREQLEWFKRECMKGTVRTRQEKKQVNAALRKLTNNPPVPLLDVVVSAEPLLKKDYKHRYSAISVRMKYVPTSDEKIVNQPLVCTCYHCPESPSFTTQWEVVQHIFNGEHCRHIHYTAVNSSFDYYVTMFEKMERDHRRIQYSNVDNIPAEPLQSQEPSKMPCVFPLFASDHFWRNIYDAVCIGPTIDQVKLITKIVESNHRKTRCFENQTICGTCHVDMSAWTVATVAGHAFSADHLKKFQNTGGQFMELDFEWWLWKLADHEENTYVINPLDTRLRIFTPAVTTGGNFRMFDACQIRQIANLDEAKVEAIEEEVLNVFGGCEYCSVWLLTGMDAFRHFVSENHFGKVRECHPVSPSDIERLMLFVNKCQKETKCAIM